MTENNNFKANFLYYKAIFHRFVFFVAIILLLIGIPFCRPFMSIGGGVLVANWFLEGKFLEKWERIKKNKALFFTLALFSVYILWFFLTDNYQQAWKDVWMKTPLLFMPIIFASSTPLTNVEINKLLKIYLIGVLISSVYGTIVFQLNNSLIDKREIAVFISYIRFEMNLCFGIATAIYLILKKEEKKYLKYLLAICIIWLCLLVFYIGALTAISILIFLALFFTLKKMLEIKNKSYKITLFSLFFIFLTGFVVYISILIKQYYTVDFIATKADKYTVEGNVYTHKIEQSLIENGSYVFSYVCEEELRNEWNQRSSIDFDNATINGKHTIKSTLIRYLNSKGLRKDREGIRKLSAEDIRYVENGIANVVYLNHFGFKARLYSFLWEMSDYNKNNKVYGYTLPQRFELWKNAYYLFLKHPWVGVGSGDAKDDFTQQLQLSNSSLKDSNKLSHNQYLFFLIQFGIIGFAIIMISFLYPIIITRKYKNNLFLAFLIIMFIAMLIDDTFERQDGVTFFAFFNAFFLFLMPIIHYKQEK